MKDRFEQPVTVNAINVTFPQNSSNKDATITLYDANQNPLHSERITDSGIYQIDSVPNVSYAEIKNESDNTSDMIELGLYGDYTETSLPAKNYHSTINILGTNHDIVSAVGWNNDKEHFDNFVVNMGTSESPIYMTLPSFRENIFTEDLISKSYGQIVKKDGVASEGVLFDDRLDYQSFFYPNGYVDYEFDSPVTVTNLYAESIPEFLNNQLQITFYDSQGNAQSLNIGDDELFQRYIDLPQAYRDVKKIRIQNTNPNQGINLKEMAFFGSYPVNTTEPIVTYQKPITLKAGDILVSDEPINPNETTYHLDSDFSTTISRGYGIKHDEGKFEWIEVTLPSGDKKWINIYHNSIDDNIPNNGLVDTLSAQIVEDLGTWASGWFTDNNIYDYPEMHPGGYVRYQFSQPTSVSSLYFKLLNLIDNQSTNFVLTLYDSNQNILYQRTLSRDDLFNQYIPFNQTISNVSSFKIENDGIENIQIGDFD